MQIKKRIMAAIKNTQETIPGYWEKTLAQRAGNSPEAAGSIYPDMDPKEIEEEILRAEWEEYSHPAIMEGCTVYKADIPGQLGIVDLNSLSPDTEVVLDDRKGTGKVSAVVEGIRGETVDYTVLILGPEEGVEVVYTFHPGSPIRPSRVEAEGLHGKKVAAQEAINLGLETAKIV